jgi:hypothetical protein
MKLIAVCGMASEAALIGMRPGVITVIGAGNATSLASKLEAVIADGADRVISFGVAGALVPQLQVGEVVVGVSVCGEGETTIHSDQAWANRLSGALKDSLRSGTFPIRFANFMSTTAPVATAAQRNALHASTAADVVDMESFIAGSVARAHGLPFAIMRAVLDTSTFELPPAALLPLTASDSPDLEAILWSAARDWQQIPKLMQLALWSGTAMGNLAIALSTVGENFAAYPTV